MSQDDEDDAVLFRRAAGKIRRLKNDRVAHERRRPRPVPRRSDRAGANGCNPLPDSDVAPPAEGALLYCRPGVQKKTMRRLRRGQIRVEEELDLHGMRVSEAAIALGTFLAECADRGLRCVRVIHGKGFGSGGGRSVLKENVSRWLELREEVVAFSSAQPADGGTGAVYVLLRR